MNESNRTDSQADREKLGEGLPVPAATGREALPTPADTSEPRTPDQNQPVASEVAVKQREIDAKATFSEFAHIYIREYISHADRKATFFFTGATALLAFLYSKNLSVRWLKPPMTWNILDMLVFVTMAALAIGSGLALLVVIPRGRGSRRGFLFWEAIAEYDTARAYADELSRLSPASLFQERSEHCFELAKICRTKYRLLRWSLWIGAFGLAGALLVFLFLGQP